MESQTKTALYVAGGLAVLVGAVVLATGAGKKAVAQPQPTPADLARKEIDAMANLVLAAGTRCGQNGAKMRADFLSVAKPDNFVKAGAAKIVAATQWLLVVQCEKLNQFDDLFPELFGGRL